MTSLAAAAEQREAGPIGLVVVLCLLVALIFLIRSMNRHLRKVPSGSFSRSEEPAPAEVPDKEPETRTPDA
jgi:Na+-transporting methylmalonyl-CoA/oxaloacetate decarboxylase gamma subunit